MRSENTQSPDFESLKQGEVTKKVLHKKSDAVKALEQLAFEDKKKKYPNFPYPIKPKFSDTTTTGLTNCIIAYIELRGFQAERINSIGQQIKVGDTTKWIKGSSQPGSADVAATIQGRSVKVEIKCKYTKDRQSEVQKKYQKQIENAGGTYLIITDFEQFYNWFNHKKVKP